jgi:glycosyltransferase involved in cell wall biosynthesis
VVFNGRKTIEKAIKSVLSQSYKNIEYVVVDGGSTDGTVEVLKKYSKKGIDIWASKKDKGLYDAMNKGVGLAHGDVVYFLNADDSFYDNDVIADFAKAFLGADSQIVFGDVIFVYPGERSSVRVSRELSIAQLKRGMMPPHQGTFASRKLLQENPFDLSYRSSSDFDWFCRVMKKGAASRKFDRVVAEFVSGGVSSGKVSYKETESVVKKHFGFFPFARLVLKHRIFSLIKFVLVKTGLLRIWHRANAKFRIL